MGRGDGGAGRGKRETVKIEAGKGNRVGDGVRKKSGEESTGLHRGVEWGWPGLQVQSAEQALTVVPSAHLRNSTPRIEFCPAIRAVICSEQADQEASQHPREKYWWRGTSTSYFLHGEEPMPRAGTGGTRCAPPWRTRVGSHISSGVSD